MPGQVGRLLWTGCLDLEVIVVRNPEVGSFQSSTLWMKTTLPVIHGHAGTPFAH